MKKKLTLVGLRLLAWISGKFIEPFLPVHDSWSTPRTPAEHDRLRLRLEQLEKMRPQPQPPVPRRTDAN